CLAGLSVLAIVPALWRRALRLTRERARLLLPQSAEEALADVDLARARVAVAERDAEIKVERANARRAAAAGALRDAHAEIERLTSLVSATQAGLAHAVEARAVSTKSIAEAAEANAGMAADAREAASRAERAGHELAQAEARSRTLEEIAERRRAAVAALETRVAGLEATIEDLRAEIARHGAGAVRPTAAHEPDALESLHPFPRAARTETAMPEGPKNTAALTTLDEDVARLRETASDAQGPRRDERLRAMVDAIGAKFLALSAGEDAKARAHAAQDA
ncbi:MAG: hypothetical protein KGQ28_10520, partial [Hyphomicrobiales bacterium]|nr:hypothetical protein [Hyphomicrobiales bacterium]